MTIDTSLIKPVPMDRYSMLVMLLGISAVIRATIFPQFRMSETLVMIPSLCFARSQHFAFLPRAHGS